MRKLLNADLSRIKKENIFWLCLIVMYIGSVVFGWMNFSTTLLYDERFLQDTIYVEDILFNLFPMMGAVCAVFISLHIGAEYEHDTIRNKLAVGHTRLELYTSNLIACTAASLAICLGMLLISGIFGYIFFKKFYLSWQELSFMILCCILVTAAFSAIFVSLATTIPNRAISVTISVVIFFLLVFVASFIGTRLMEGQMTYENMTITMDGIQYGDLVENPAYVSGIRRTVYEFIYDFLPTGQAKAMNGMNFDRCTRWPITSAVVLVVSTVLGYYSFCKKDIK